MYTVTCDRFADWKQNAKKAEWLCLRLASIFQIASAQPEGLEWPARILFRAPGCLSLCLVRPGGAKQRDKGIRDAITASDAAKALNQVLPGGAAGTFLEASVSPQKEDLGLSSCLPSPLTS